MQVTQSFDVTIEDIETVQKSLDVHKATMADLLNAIVSEWHVGNTESTLYLCKQGETLWWDNMPLGDGYLMSIKYHVIMFDTMHN